MILPALKDFKDIEKFSQTPYKQCVILDTHIGHLSNVLSLLKDKQVFIHIDLIKGLSTEDAAVEYIIQKYKPYGIISTKQKTINKAKQLGVKTILRVFIIDSSALARSISIIEQTEADYIEVLPGIASKVIKEVRKKTDKRIIAGGLIDTPDEVALALADGAYAVTTSNCHLWSGVERDI
ncbi:glycerol-3-phosphate responsive antiterminator [Macrococcus hajekii]|uniref:Glycerol uptake operon antiterminator regulatory protein n=1 Tax=Macrococcus hajekii TaxID=198482 RepID=A0A4R6BMQ3_9STAP|nr:glycerol-3-phosphate responsive antiterminator [Macrococcus hajekii]TDM03119.1 glycerol-3-phosphate responsive antiterminator [Macrococcus hajekii]GGA96128.1 glycerol uptake operon antiterminator regulatory protein [Macrococcus hajekii]